MRETRQQRSESQTSYMVKLGTEIRAIKEDQEAAERGMRKTKSI